MSGVMDEIFSLRHSTGKLKVVETVWMSFFFDWLPATHAARARTHAHARTQGTEALCTMFLGNIGVEQLC